MYPPEKDGTTTRDYEIEKTTTLFEGIKSCPVDLSHPSIEAESKDSLINRVMLNTHDNGRCFWLDPSAPNNQPDGCRGIIPNLLWI